MPQIKTRQLALARFERCCSINIIDVNRIDVDRKVDVQTHAEKQRVGSAAFGS